jgi:hypothetical protein
MEDELHGNRLTEQEADQLQEAVGLLSHLQSTGQMKEFIDQIEKNINAVLWTAAPTIKTEVGIRTRTPPYFIEDDEGWD